MLQNLSCLTNAHPFIMQVFLRETPAKFCHIFHILPYIPVSFFCCLAIFNLVITKSSPSCYIGLLPMFHQRVLIVLGRTEKNPLSKSYSGKSWSIKSIKCLSLGSFWMDLWQSIKRLFFIFRLTFWRLKWKGRAKWSGIFKMR